MSTTIFECRCCPNLTDGLTDGTFLSDGWARVQNIDGPNALCDECAGDEEVIEEFKADMALDGYENVVIVRTGPTAAEKAREARVFEIEKRMDYMNENYSGCDWCEECGGGSTEMDALVAELKELNHGR